MAQQLSTPRGSFRPRSVTFVGCVNGWTLNTAKILGRRTSFPLPMRTLALLFVTTLSSEAAEAEP
jgi:hypothetical protein